MRPGRHPRPPRTTSIALVASVRKSRYDEDVNALSPSSSPSAAVDLIRGLADLFRKAGYGVSEIIRDPCALSNAYVFYVDDGQFKDPDGVKLPTAVHFSPASREVKFDGALSQELEHLVQRTSR